MGNIASPRWDVTRGKRLLVPRPPCNATATKKVLMLFAALAIPERELVSLGTTKTLATAVTPESGLVQQFIRMVTTRVET